MFYVSGGIEFELTFSFCIWSLNYFQELEKTNKHPPHVQKDWINVMLTGFRFNQFYDQYKLVSVGHKLGSIQHVSRSFEKLKSSTR